MESPLGRLRLVEVEGRLAALDLAPRARRKPPPAGAGGAVLRETARQLRAYFTGRLQVFDLPLVIDDGRGAGRKGDRRARERGDAGTPFLRSVWRALRRIPYGSTITYAQLARRVGKPTAVRAVGAANGRNPLVIVVPCHRVIGSNGRLTGYGGGLEKKAWLLRHEGAIDTD